MYSHGDRRKIRPNGIGDVNEKADSVPDNKTVFANDLPIVGLNA